MPEESREEEEGRVCVGGEGVSASEWFPNILGQSSGGVRGRWLQLPLGGVAAWQSSG